MEMFKKLLIMLGLAMFATLPTSAVSVNGIETPSPHSFSSRSINGIVTSSPHAITRSTNGIEKPSPHAISTTTRISDTRNGIARTYVHSDTVNGMSTNGRNHVIPVTSPHYNGCYNGRCTNNTYIYPQRINPATNKLRTRKMIVYTPSTSKNKTSSYGGTLVMY